MSRFCIAFIPCLYVLAAPAWGEAALPGQDAYLSASDALRLAQFGDAAKLFGQTASAGGPLAPYALIRIAYCRDKAGDSKGAVSAYEELLQGFPEGPWVSMAKAYLAEAMRHQQRNAEAAALLQGLLDAPAIPRWLRDYQWMYAECLTATPGREAEGYALFSSIMDGVKLRADRQRAAEWLARSVNVDHRLQAIDGFLRLSDYPTARLLLGAMALEAGGFDADTAARYTLMQGRLLAVSKEAEEGRTLLARVVTDRPGSATAATALGYLARNYIHAKQVEQAVPLVERMMAEFPGVLDTGDTLWALGRYYADNQQAAAAAEVFAKLAESCTDHANADDALIEAGMILHEQGKNEQALKAFGELAHRYPLSTYLAEAGYRMGHIYEDLKQPERAKAAYNEAVNGHLSDFFAHRAMARLHAMGQSNGDLPAGIVANGLANYMHPIPVRDAHRPGIGSPAEVTLDAASEWLRRLAFFALHGLEEAEWEGWHAVQAATGTPLEGPVYRALSEAGLMAMASQIVEARNWGMAETGPTVERLRVLYPRAYWPVAEAQAREAGVDPYLLMAIARQESLFQARIASHAGATGVMQIMPGTAQWMAKVEPSVSPDHVANLENPVNSIRLGAFYITRMIARSDGNLVYALASYNAGPGNLSKWRRQFDTADMDDFIERIPYTETKKYVKRVLGNYAAYYSLYETK
ncbi:MAG: hypothetical protein AMXMBFR84_02100 [Candidatus Hydrogenedentota bacterium]